MPRPLRMEFEGGVYHVINRGNYRQDVFKAERTKAAFLKCLNETCEKTDWRIHAWCVMSNHFHLAVETPQANLVDGMSWLQGTFSTRFNRLRKEQGHLFQGRYRSLIVDPGESLGSLCHYIHLNPVRAGLCDVSRLAKWPWSSACWLFNPRLREKWFEPEEFLRSSGNLADTTAGRRKYADYLEWLACDEQARKELRFDQMSKGWAIGTKSFKKDLLKDHQAYAAARRLGEVDLEDAREAALQEVLDVLLRKLGQSRKNIASDGKFEKWKIAVAAAMKSRTTVSNTWLKENLGMGSIHEISRQVSAWIRNPDGELQRRLK
ncbi:MAG: transposase [Opitutaceae bacterium]